MAQTKYGEEIGKRIEKATDALDRQMSQIAAEVRERLVVPLCRRRGFGFLSGNCDYYFYGMRRGESVRYGDSLDGEAPADVRRVLAVLDIEITRANYLGFYVEAVEAEVPTRLGGPLAGGTNR